MGFLVNKITGNGTTQTAITNDATLEAVVNSLVAYNRTAGALSFTVSINGSTIFSQSVGANSTFRLPDKINLGAVSTLEVNAPTGLDVTVSYLQQAIDVAGALSAAQLLAQQASDDADRAEAALGNNSNPVITGSITEEVYELVGTVLDPINGTIQYKTLGANTTFTESLADGQSVTLMLNPVTYTVTWPTITWIGSKASTAPTLVASVFNCITLFQFGGVVYGKYEGRV